MWASGQSWIIYNSRPKQLQQAQNILWLQWMLITVGGIIYTILCPKISLHHILLKYSIFINTSGFKWFSFNSDNRF